MTSEICIHSICSQKFLHLLSYPEGKFSYFDRAKPCPFILSTLKPKIKIYFLPFHYSSSYDKRIHNYDRYRAQIQTSKEICLQSRLFECSNFQKGERIWLVWGGGVCQGMRREGSKHESSTGGRGRYRTRAQGDILFCLNCIFMS